MRPPVPPGVIPHPAPVSSTDEQYGHQVLQMLNQQYPLDRDDDNINRTRDIVDKLAKAAQADQDPWHVYVLVDDSFINAAATRGNHLFVWTGLLKTVQNDDELATVLAHEFGHLLAEHPKLSSAEETSIASTQVAGSVTRGVVSGTSARGLASLAGLLVQETLKAIVVNPESQRKELEADLIGMFLMAESGYNPQSAVNFWDRIKDTPYFSSSPLTFLSSHPSSEERLQQLRKYLPDAMARYRHEPKPKTARIPSPASNQVQYDNSSAQTSTWTLTESQADVFSSPSSNSKVVKSLTSGENVEVIDERRGWLEIVSPVKGFVRGRYFSPPER